MNKTAIKNFAIWSRVTLIDAVKQKAFEYDITEQGGEASAVAVGGRLLTETEKKQRAALISQIAQKGYAQVMEEAAYTWFNRFIALRYMEVNNFLPFKIRLFSDENDEFNPEILKEAMNVELDGIDKNTIFDLIEKQDNEKLYKYLLIAQCNALGECLPGMFEKIEDYTELLFPNNLLKSGSVLDKMVTEIPTEDWEDAVQIIGWMYQYYNAELKDDTFAKLKKNIKISKERIPAATQLFTPDWIVRYMVENSLGRLFIVDSGKWLVDSMTEAERAAKEKEVAESFGWKYYLPEAEQEPEVRAQLITNHSSLTTNFDVTNIKVIDPCMGSGHILVYAFDVLMQMYSECGWSERDAAKSILENNLFGLDIDDRAGQLAYFAVMMKARKYNRRILNGGTKPNVMAIQESNNFNSDYLSLFGELKDKALMLMENMKDAKELGSIIQVKLTVEDLSALKEKAEEIKNYYFDNFFDTAKQAGIVTEFIPLINQAIILAQKYDTVVTNPPYMGRKSLNNTISLFLDKNYKDGKNEMYSAFIIRCMELTNENGYTSMITIHTWMFISSFKSLRYNIINSELLISMLHTGAATFEDLNSFNVLATVFIRQKRFIKGFKGAYKRLTQYYSTEEKIKYFHEEKNCYFIEQSTLNSIQDQPIVYWLSNRTFDIFKNSPKIDSFGTLTNGLFTCDNNRFVRNWWEVSVNDTKFDCFCSDEAIRSNKKWFPYIKGGNYRKWYGNNENVVYYEKNGDEIRHFRISQGQSKKFPGESQYFKPGITWSPFGFENFGVRYKYPGSIFDIAGSSLFVESDVLEKYILAFLASNVGFYFLSTLAPTVNFQIGNIGSLPLLVDEKEDTISGFANENIRASKFDWDSFETSWDFKKHPLV